MADLQVNYFVCTLGQAATLNEQNTHAYKTINEFFDEQALSSDPAVGFPRPLASQGEREKEQWDYEVLSMKPPALAVRRLSMLLSLIL